MRPGSPVKAAKPSLFRSRTTGEQLTKPLLSRQGTVPRSSTAIDAALLSCSLTEEFDEYRISNPVQSRRVWAPWEKPDDGAREATDAGYGIKYLKHVEKGHQDKLLEYETAQLESRPWAIILDETRRASVLAMPHVKRSMGMCALLSIAAIGTSLLLEEEVMTVISQVNSVVSAGLFFLLGPYVGLCLTRWWQMRIEFLGGVWGAVSDLNLYASIWFHSGSKADEAARSLVRRYGLLAHLLLYKDGRGQTNVDDAIGKGLLLPHEAAVLQPLPSRTQMVFTWLVVFFNKALSEEGAKQLGTTPVPHAPMQAPLVLKRCLDGRGAAGGALALVYTQLPFPYVHLLSMLVQTACVLNAIVEGAKTGWILSAPTCVGDAELGAAHHFRFEMQEGCPPAIFIYHWSATCLIFCGFFVSILIYPVIYHGLLSIGVMLSNPLGTDLIDFPGSFYQHIMKSELEGFAKCTDAINLKVGKGAKWWEGLGAANQSSAAAASRPP